MTKLVEAENERERRNADWHFFTCITKNRIGADHCTGMYAREEDVIAAVYRALEARAKDLFIITPQYKAKIHAMEQEIMQATAAHGRAFENAMRHYEKCELMVIFLLRV